MSLIHNTSLISPKAKIGNNVKIGPFCVIANDVVIGDDSEIANHVVIKKGTIIGEGAKIFSHAILGGEPQNNKHKGGYTSLEIGKNCVIREGVTMHKGSDNCNGKTIIGNNCMFLAYAHVAHDCIVGNNVTLANNVMLGGHVELGDNVNIGGGGAVHQFVRVGHNAFVGGLAALVRDLIPYGTAIGVQAHFAGLNIVGMKRFDIARAEIHNARHAVKKLFDKSKPVSERVYEIQAEFENSPLVQDIINFILKDTKRFYCIPS